MKELNIRDNCQGSITKQFFKSIIHQYSKMMIQIDKIYIPENHKQDIYHWTNDKITIDIQDIKRELMPTIVWIKPSVDNIAYAYGNNFLYGEIKELTLEILF